MKDMRHDSLFIEVHVVVKLQTRPVYVVTITNSEVHNVEGVVIESLVDAS